MGCGSCGVSTGSGAGGARDAPGCPPEAPQCDAVPQGNSGVTLRCFSGTAGAGATGRAVPLMCLVPRRDRARGAAGAGARRGRRRRRWRERGREKDAAGAGFLTPKEPHPCGAQGDCAQGDSDATLRCSGAGSVAVSRPSWLAGSRFARTAHLQTVRLPHDPLELDPADLKDLDRLDNSRLRKERLRKEA
jgi:hypothetical protein